MSVAEMCVATTGAYFVVVVEFGSVNRPHLPAIVEVRRRAPIAYFVSVSALCCQSRTEHAHTASAPAVHRLDGTFDTYGFVVMVCACVLRAPLDKQGVLARHWS